MKSRWLISAFAALSLTAGCLVEEDGADRIDAVDEAATEATTSTVESAVRGPQWYYTCSDELLACSPGYGAVEWTYYPDCIPYGASHRVKCVLGAIDP